MFRVRVRSYSTDKIQARQRQGTNDKVRVRVKEKIQS
jgi:hypothetical protein